MSNPFAPSFQAPVQAPAIAQAQAAPQVVQTSAAGLDDPTLYQGHNSPFLPHVAGSFDFEVVGFAGSVGHSLGPAIHVSLKALTSTSPEVQIGQTYRVACKYNYQSDMPMHGDDGKMHAQILGRIVSAIFGRDAGDPAFNKTLACKQLQAHDWSTQPGRVQLVSTLKPGKTDPTKSYRRETWLPAPAAQ